MTHAPARRTDEDEDDDTPVPPDGGWGWMVAFASFMIHIVTDGITYSMGVFYVQFLDYFKGGKGPTAWILSILVGVTLCSGPISSAFVNKYGCRPVTIAGSLLASGCMFLSIFAQNVTTLYFTIGIGTGFGFGLIYLPAIVSVTNYFEKYRSLATGIAVCGSGLGTFIFSPIIDILITEYGWRGSMAILAAIVLNCMIFGAMFRPLEWEKSNKKSQVKYTKENGCSIKINGENVKSISHDELENHNFAKSESNIQRPLSMGQFSLTRSLRVEKNGNVIPENLKNGHGEVSRLALSTPLLISSVSEPYNKYGSQSFKKSGPLSRKDVFYQGSLMNIPQYKSRSDLKYEDHEHARPPSSRSHRTRTVSIKEEEPSKYCGCLNQETKETLVEMMDLSLLKDPIFFIFTLSNFLTSIGFNVPYVHLASKAEELGISKPDASLLISVIGIANTISRIVLGYLSDKPWVNRLWVYNGCLAICGAATALSAFCLDYVSLIVYSAIFGFTIGAYVGLTSVILVDLLGLDKLTNAFGILLLFQGIASLIGPPIVGSMYDALGSYDPGFYLAGITLAISGLMLFFIPSLQRYLARKEAEKLKSAMAIENGL